MHTRLPTTLSAMGCAGLCGYLLGAWEPGASSSASRDADARSACPREAEVARRLDQLAEREEAQLAASWGAPLGGAVPADVVYTLVDRIAADVAAEAVHVDCEHEACLAGFAWSERSLEARHRVVEALERAGHPHVIASGSIDPDGATRVNVLFLAEPIGDDAQRVRAGRLMSRFSLSRPL
jgi:hypothetical protein